MTPARYMQFRERESSSSVLGFRVEGVKVGSNPGTTDFKKVRTRDDVRASSCLFRV